MLSEERYRVITERLDEKRSVTVNELAEEFGVSIETIRRDLVFLEAQGQLRRVFGGAVTNASNSKFDDFPVRVKQHREEKAAVARKLAELIYENDVISIDVGTTALELAAVLKENFRKLTIVTHSLKVFEAVKDFDAILLGGEFYRQEEAFYGELAVGAMERLHVNKCFIFPSAVTLAHGVEDYVPCLMPVQKSMMRHADSVIVAADSSKFVSRALIQLCGLSPDHVYVTDACLPDETAAAFAEQNYNLLIGD